ncbi:ATP-binding cassette sub- A member 1 [Terramyces sp. JEL0728]|nr:ATP-binding cassette sub- A member 1 [Terramyces sp. JEL0728]
MPPGFAKKVGPVRKDMNDHIAGHQASWISQLFIMLKRNSLIQMRFWRTYLVQTVGAPLMFMILIYIFQQADFSIQSMSNKNPASHSLSGVYGCTPQSRKGCINIMYTPDTAAVRSYLSAFAQKNALRTGEPAFDLQSGVTALNQVPLQKVGMIPVANTDFLYRYVVTNPNTTNWGINFDIKTGTVTNIRYQVWYNHSRIANGVDVFGEQLVALTRGLDEAIMSVAGNTPSTVNFDVKMMDWPVVPPSTLSDTIVQNLGPVFFFCCVMVIFINVLSQILEEKEKKLRIGMEVMGLKPSVYWISHFLTNSFLIFVGAWVTVALGIAFGFKAFTKSNVFVSLVLSFLPFFNFGLMFLMISSLTNGRIDSLTNTAVAGPGMPWSSIYSQIPSDYTITYSDGISAVPPAPVMMFYWFLIDIAFYSVLTWYLDCVIANEFGFRLPYNFLFTSSYWGFNEKKDMEHSKALLMNIINANSIPLPKTIDADVLLRRELALSKDYWQSVKIAHLRKDYTTFTGKVAKTAVHDTCISFETGKLVALLGQNGAGKSTTINILSGLTPPSGGNALIYGHSLTTEMHQIRKIMGVCPQHDILFNELTAREHIELYAGLKGVPKKDWESIVTERLQAVRLLHVADNPVNTYSGGMKRRLSVVISTIGDPKIVYLDEPTTGMDPVNRRHVWSFIEKFKTNRVIILTTHSMEEADVLGDQIVIMAKGRIRAVGNSSSLKTKFGVGYKLSVITEPDRLKHARNLVLSHMPDAELEDASAGALLYQFPFSSLPSVSLLVKTLNADASVKSWGISQTTLEQVFLTITRYGENPIAEKASENTLI